ncbi:hypothetical protein LUU34_00535800 [Aix galericulata]|nr:hypothetical protein LUU34_00535800 [Aix galericulata]
MAAAPAGAPPLLPLGAPSLLRVGKSGVGRHGEKRSSAESKLVVGCGCPSGEPNYYKTTGTYQLTNTIKYHINAFLANGVVATGIVISCVFLSSDQLFWMEKLPEGAIRLNAVLQAEEFPARISYLNSSLADMNGDALTLGRESRERMEQISDGRSLQELSFELQGRRQPGQYQAPAAALQCHSALGNRSETPQFCLLHHRLLPSQPPQRLDAHDTEGAFHLRRTGEFDNPKMCSLHL